MKIIDFTLKEGFFKKKIVFNNTFNLVYSKENSSGRSEEHTSELQSH